MYVTITIPNKGPISGDYYYVLLSVWDNQNNYDQIGFASNYNAPGGFISNPSDSWDITWDYLTNCAQNTAYGTNYAVNAANLIPGQTYTFEMYIQTGNQQLVYAVHSGGITGPRVWQLVETDTATAFWVQGSWSCNSHTYDDYTDFEEVFVLSNQNFPNWDFNFTNNAPSPGAQWDRLTSALTPPSPHGYYAVLGTHYVVLANEAFTGFLSKGSISVPRGSTTAAISGSVAAVGGYCLAHPCYLFIPWSLPGAGWGGSAGYCATLPCQISVTLTVPASAACTQYYPFIWIEVGQTPYPWTNGAWEYTQFMLYTTVTGC